MPENGTPFESSAPPIPSTPSADRTTTRLAVLEVAARFLATRPDAKSADVLSVAAIAIGEGGRRGTARAGSPRGSWMHAGADDIH